VLLRSEVITHIRLSNDFPVFHCEGHQSHDTLRKQTHTHKFEKPTLVVDEDSHTKWVAWSKAVVSVSRVVLQAFASELL
jgi:hypothetical protein